MRVTRRDFTKRLGIALASLVLTRCVRLGNGDDSPRGQIRDCWSGFNRLAEQTRRDDTRGRGVGDDLVAQHRAALDALVADGSLEPGVADQVQSAFAAAVYHVWRSNTAATCYEPVLVDYTPVSSGQLAQQAAILSEMAEGVSLDPAAVAQAQAAIERDIAFLNLSSVERDALYGALMAAVGDGGGFPSFEELDLQVTPEAAAATGFLVELLLGE
jgi:hypothetical protein